MVIIRNSNTNSILHFRKDDPNLFIKLISQSNIDPLRKPQVNIGTIILELNWARQMDRKKIQFCELYAVPNLGVTKFY